MIKKMCIIRAKIQRKYMRMFHEVGAITRERERDRQGERRRERDRDREGERQTERGRERVREGKWKRE